MRITDLLRGEHGALHAQLDRVEAMLLDVRSVDEVRWRAAGLLFSLKSHAHIEEELLMEPMASTAPEGAQCREEIEEEHLVFPRAEASIDDTELKRLGRCWADRRRVYIPNASDHQKHRPKRF